MIELSRNSYGVGFFTIEKTEFCKKMDQDRFFCDDCNKYVEDGEIVTVIPFLGSAYCKDCGQDQLVTCRATDIDEEEYKVEKEATFLSIFND